jgi:recombination protein RecA
MIGGFMSLQKVSQGPSTEKLKALDLALSAIEKQFGKGAIMKLDNKEVVEKIPAIPTGCLSLDLALGIGGIPQGRIIEIYGPESSGKTTLTLHMLTLQSLALMYQTRLFLNLILESRH